MEQLSASLHAITPGMATKQQTSAPLKFRVARQTIVPSTPAVPKAPQGRLNFHQAMYEDDSLEVTVQPFAGMAGQSITVTWTGPFAAWTSPAQVVDNPRALSFQVPRLEVIDAIGGAVRIHCTVNGTIESSAYSLTIDPQLINLPAPRFYPQEGEPTAAVSLLYNEQVTGHSGRVRWYLDYQLYWESEEQHLETGEAEYFQVPRSVVTASRGKVAMIDYTILRRSGEQLQFSRMLRQQF
ncbi:hypothetical protein [Pseudomonas sp. PSKL.D1]|uniref:hypothetical protein n=1 Tax=Pseudomonas sp. PSKL.D1 TaxID=3029060 RepID=UPI0023815B87|nr:hypothetical protein [Pseudomonas sp. PSKL.D1]WDY59525.1 hypothetical protein PVV54_07850 [Pseudomonas sp. PSKL.D1]